MSNHFGYLLEDNSTDFFHGVAMEKIAETVLAPPLATSQPMRGLDKVATAPAVAGDRYDRDIAMLREAGSIGLNLGMCKRASVYLEQLSLDDLIGDDEFLSAFDKVAAAAIAVDIDEALRGLKAELPTELHAHIEQQLSKIALDKLAAPISAATEALRAVQGAKRVRLGGSAAAAVKAPSISTEAAKAIQGTPTKGLLTRGVEALKGIPEKLRHARAAVPAAFSHGIPAAFNEAQAARRGAKAMALDKQVAQAANKAETAGSAAGRAFQGQVAKNLANQREGVLAAGRGNLQRLDDLGGGASKPGGAAERGRARIEESKKGLEEATEKATGEASKATEGAEKATRQTRNTGAIETPKPPAGGGEGGKSLDDWKREADLRAQGKWDNDKGVPKGQAGGQRREPAKSEAKPAGGDEAAKGADKAENAAKPAGDDEPAGKLGDTWSKFMKGERLSHAEKMQLGKTGVGAIGAHRVFTGRDLLTGDKSE